MRWTFLVAWMLGAVGLAASPQQTPSFRAGTTLIEVDAIVRDGKGQFVANLAPADFEVRENGESQQIEAFYQVRGRDIIPAPGAPLPPIASPIPPVQAAPGPALAAPRTQRVFVLVFDTDNIQPGSFDRAKKAAEAFLSTDFLDGDVGGIVAGGTMVNNRLSPVREELLAAVKAIKPTGEALAVMREMRRDWPRILDAFEAYMLDRMDRDTISRVVERACSDDPGACGRGAADQMVLEKARRLLPALRNMGLRTMETVKALSSGLGRIPGRKTIIFLSDGFYTEDSWANLKQVTDLAARADVRIYTLDTRGLDRTGDVFEKGPQGSVNPAGDVAGFDTGADGPNSLAVDTGGMVIRHENDFAKALREFADDTSNYYVIGYRPTNTTFDGKFRKIALRVRRPGVSVRARQGYLATPDRAVTPPPAQPLGADPAPANAVPPPTPDRAAAPPAVAPPPAAGRPAGQPVPLAAPAAAGSPEAPRDLGPLAVRARPHVDDQVSGLTAIGAASAGSARLPEALARQARGGWEAYQKGDLKAARTELGAAAAHTAAPPWVHYALGWSLYAASEYSAAGSAWERVRSRVPEFEPVYFDLADSYVQQREFGKAVAVLREAERRWSKDVDVYNALGVAQLARGSVDEAIQTFETAVRVAPNDANACYNLAKTYEVRFVRADRLGKVGPGAVSPTAAMLDRDRALEYYRQVIQIGGALVDAAKEGVKRLGERQ